MNGFSPAGVSLLPFAFFARSTPLVARELLGKVLVSTTGDTLHAGAIVEAEAYLGAHDAGSHAATQGITAQPSVGLRSGHVLPLRFYIMGNEYVSKRRTGPRPPLGAGRLQR